MANTCTTAYRIIVEDKDTFDRLANVFDKGMKAAEGQPYNLLSIATEAGVSPQYLENWRADAFDLEGYKLEDNRFELSVWVDSAWSPDNKAIGYIVDAIAEKGRACLYYCADEGGNSYCATNNPDFVGEYEYEPYDDEPDVDVPVYEYHSLEEWGCGHLEPEIRVSPSPQRIERIYAVRQNIATEQERNMDTWAKTLSCLKEHGYINDKSDGVWYKKDAENSKATFITDEGMNVLVVHGNYDSCVEYPSSPEEAVRFADYADFLLDLWCSNNMAGSANFDFALAWKITCHTDSLEAALDAATETLNAITEKDVVSTELKVLKAADENER